VLELTRDPQVSIAKIAQAVQNDPALCAKVLKTVNSSYYGLSSPCPGITRAMGMLGLATVKALILGFSLVDSTKKVGLDASFDLTAHWRRAVYGAAAARAIAIHVRSCDPEEAFVGSLVQDIGTLACFAALRAEYQAILKAAPADHDEIIGLEKEALGFDHASVGALLAERWHLPPQLIECIRCHHSESQAHPTHVPLVRTVVLANLCAGALTLQDPKRKLGGFIVNARDWFGMDSPTARNLIEQAARGAAELSKLLGLKTGAQPDVAAILVEAHERMVVAQEDVQKESVELRRSNDDLAKKNVTDTLTGAFNRAYFDRALATAFEHCKASGGSEPLSVIFIDAEQVQVRQRHTRPPGGRRGAENTRSQAPNGGLSRRELLPVRR